MERLANYIIIGEDGKALPNQAAYIHYFKAVAREVSSYWVQLTEARWNTYWESVKDRMTLEQAEREFWSTNRKTYQDIFEDCAREASLPPLVVLLQFHPENMTDRILSQFCDRFEGVFKQKC